MNEQHHGNLLGGAIGETTQTAAQLAAVIATAAQARGADADPSARSRPGP